MSAQDHLSFQFREAKPDLAKSLDEPSFNHNRLYAQHPETKELMGHLAWHPQSGEIKDLRTFKEHRRQGVATALWNHAQTMKDVVHPVHSDNRTDAGDAWAKKVSPNVPERKKNTGYAVDY